MPIRVYANYFGGHKFANRIWYHIKYTKFRLCSQSKVDFCKYFNIAKLPEYFMELPVSDVYLWV